MSGPASRPGIGSVPNTGDNPLIRKRYRKDELIGRGGMGEVWRGFDVSLERPVPG